MLIDQWRKGNSICRSKRFSETEINHLFNQCTKIIENTKGDHFNDNNRQGC